MFKITHIDCTLRDGGYYNNWDFSNDLILDYISAMAAASVDIIELGFRSFDIKGYRGSCAYTTDRFLKSLNLPATTTIAVMVNAAELLNHQLGAMKAVSLLFSKSADSPVSMVRIACHAHEVEDTMPACDWLVEAGYRVGLNLMQVADRSEEELVRITAHVDGHGIEVLYFADSLGSLDPETTARIVRAIRRGWNGPLGIHTHDNMGRAVSNTLRAIHEGVDWVDSTVTGMGRGPGNAQTEYLVIELERLTERRINLAPVLALISKHFGPMKALYRWGQNPFYYLAGQYGIHPTYLQEMLSDSRYSDEDILSVIEHLRKAGGKKYIASVLEQGRQRYGTASPGTWRPAELIEGREVLIVGAGLSASAHREAIEQYIRQHDTYVVVLNTQSTISAPLINIRVACHPVRLVADCNVYRRMTQPLVVPVNGLDFLVRESLATTQLYDFGMMIESNTFRFNDTDAVVPSSLVIAYALAMCASGRAQRILLAGFDGYTHGDPRNDEMEELLSLYQATDRSPPILSVTPTVYSLPVISIYAM
jgi:4-hydroxy 2-oxovalerate aldolase